MCEKKRLAIDEFYKFFDITETRVKNVLLDLELFSFLHCILPIAKMELF